METIKDLYISAVFLPFKIESTRKRMLTAYSTAQTARPHERGFSTFFEKALVSRVNSGSELCLFSKEPTTPIFTERRKGHFTIP
jgi:hypothetical protein